MSFLGFKILSDKRYDALKERAERCEVVIKDNSNLRKSIEEKDVEIEQNL